LVPATSPKWATNYFFSGKLKKEFVPLKTPNAKMRFGEAKQKIAFLLIDKSFALSQKTRLLVLLSLSIIMAIATFSATAYSG
jgi:hypothetical protein